MGARASAAYAAYAFQTVELREAQSGPGFSESWALDLEGLTPTTLSNMICIGKNVPVGKGDIPGSIENIYVSPSGQVLMTEVCTGAQDAQSLLSCRTDEISGWSSDDLDDVAYGYFFSEDGQAATVIDAMCRCGLCKYSESERLSGLINGCLSSRSFIYLLFVRG